MLACHIRHLVQHLHFLLIILSSQYLYASATADRKYCGNGLADTLRLLCRGKYKTRIGSDGSTSSSADVVTESLTQECCHRSCGVATLMAYCATPDPHMAMMFSRIPQAGSASKGLPKPSSGAQVLAAETPSSGSQPKSRLSEILNNRHTFDVSPYLETRPDDIYQSLPFRQR